MLFIVLQNLVWSFGVNRNVPVLNLSNDDRKVYIFEFTVKSPSIFVI